MRSDAPFEESLVDFKTNTSSDKGFNLLYNFKASIHLPIKMHAL